MKKQIIKIIKKQIIKIIKKQIIKCILFYGLLMRNYQIL